MRSMSPEPTALPETSAMWQNTSDAGRSRTDRYPPPSAPPAPQWYETDMHFPAKLLQTANSHQGRRLLRQ